MCYEMVKSNVQGRGVFLYRHFFLVKRKGCIFQKRQYCCCLKLLLMASLYSVGLSRNYYIVTVYYRMKYVLYFYLL